MTCSLVGPATSLCTSPYPVAIWMQSPVTYAETVSEGEDDMLRSVVVHGRGPLPCLQAWLHTSTAPATCGRIALLGGEGTLGRGITNHLSGIGYEVVSVDRAINCGCGSRAAESATAPQWEEHFASLWQLLPTSFGCSDEYSGLITATRARPRAAVTDPSNPLSGLHEHLEAALLAPVAAAKSIRAHLRNEPRPSILFLSSTNARSLSHQVLGYHAANAALSQAARYLGVHWINEVSVFCVQVGAIHTASTEPKRPEELGHFPGVSQQDLYETICFLMEAHPQGLVGEPIVLSSGRDSLDATAVHQGRFGDLSRY